MILIFLIFFILSLILLSGHGSSLIAGYNTAPAEERKKYDEKKLCRVAGAGLMVITILLGIQTLLGDQMKGAFVTAFAALTMTDVGVMLYVMNRKCYNKDWDGQTTGMTEQEKRRNRRRIRGSIAFCAVVIILVGILLMTGNINVQYEEHSFTIKADYWADETIAYEDITSVEFREGDDPGSRVSGFESFRLELGNFNNVEFGAYTRYTYRRCNAVVILTVRDEHIILNGIDEEQTKKIYDTLLERAAS